MPKMKARAVQNDEGNGHWKAEVTYSPCLQGAPSGEQVSLAMDNASKLAYAEGVVCPAAAKRGKGQQAALRNSPSQAALATLKRSPASLCEHLRSDKSQSAAFICLQSL